MGATTVGNVTIDLPQLDSVKYRVREAQKKLNMQIVADCEPFVPFLQGGLRNSVRYPNGIYGNIIEYNVPYARYMYGGLVYSPNIPRYDKGGNIVGWFSPKGKKKTPTNRPLQYTTPGTGGHWFERAKNEKLDSWIKLVNDTLTKE